MTTIDSGERRGRSDIQALRGYAVLLVIFYHANLGIAPFGFLGVDIFFVISGYLITGIIARGLRAGTFGLQDFYLRRVRRLFPAAFVTLLLTLVGSVFVLTSSAWQNFAPQLYGALVFATNVVLWQQINYFKSSAELEPLLHMWSLAVEEQYYLLLPVVLRIVPRRLWIGCIAAITLGSLGAYVWLYPHSPGAAFYLLPTRAWEIGIGACVTFLPPLARNVPARRLVAIAAALLLVALPFVPLPFVPSHLLALPAALATAALLYVDIPQRGLDWLERPLGWFGDRSYSLYLLHWPLFALTRNVYLAQPLPLWLVCVLLALTVGLAAVLYRLVEEPIRRSRMPAKRIWTMLIAGTLLLGLGGWIAARHAAASRPALDLAPVRGLPVPACLNADTPFTGKCAQGPAPAVLIWGDSLSEAITPAIDVSLNEPIVQASMGQCAPLLDIAPNDVDSPTPYGQSCIAHNRSVLDYAVRSPTIRVVILTGFYLRYAQAGTLALTPNGTVAPSTALVAAAQARLTAALRRAGKRVVVIAPPPQSRFDIGACWERALQQLPTVAAAPDCALIPATRRPEEAATARLFAAFAAQGTPVIPLDRMICPDAPSRPVCPTQWNGRPLYRDATHLNQTGSILIGQRFRLGALAWRTAR